MAHKRRRDVFSWKKGEERPVASGYVFQISSSFRLEIVLFYDMYSMQYEFVFVRLNAGKSAMFAWIQI